MLDQIKETIFGAATDEEKPGVLPASSQAKLDDFDRERTERANVAYGWSQKEFEAVNDLREVQARFDRHVEEAARTGKDDSFTRSQLEREVTQKRRAIEAAQKNRSRSQDEPRRCPAQLHGRLRMYIRQVSHLVLRPAPVEPVNIGRNKIESAIADIRNEIEAANLKVIGVDHAWPPLAEREKALRARINKDARAPQGFEHLAAHRHEAPLPVFTDDYGFSWPKIPGGRDYDSIGLLLWTHGDALFERARVELAKRYESPSTTITVTRDGKRVTEHVPVEVLTAAERRKRLTQVAHELLMLGYEEELRIECAESHGLIVPRRPHADPRAVLLLDPKLPPLRGDDLDAGMSGPNVRFAR